MRSWFGLAALVVALAACGGGNGDKPEPGAAQTAITADDQQRAEEIVLRLSDFPSGWRTESEEDEPDGSRCTDLSGLTVSGRAESVDFRMGEVAQVGSKASVLASESDAREGFSRLASDETLSCVLEGTRDAIEDGDVEVTDSSFGSLSFPELGEQSAAYQVVLELEERTTLYIDVVFIRDERAVGSLLFADVYSPFDNSLKEKLAQLVADRMRPSAA